MSQRLPLALSCRTSVLAADLGTRHKLPPIWGICGFSQDSVGCSGWSDMVVGRSGAGFRLSSAVVRMRSDSGPRSMILAVVRRPQMRAGQLCAGRLMPGQLHSHIRRAEQSAPVRNGLRAVAGARLTQEEYADAGRSMDTTPSARPEVRHCAAVLPARLLQAAANGCEVWRGARRTLSQPVPGARPAMG